MAASPPTVTVRRARGAPAVSPGVDFAMCIIGASSTTPLATGALSLPYYDGSALAADYGIGDGVDAAGHALLVSDDNPAPPGLCFLSTSGMSGLTAGVRGSIDVTGVTGTSVVTNTASTHPFGTWQPRVRVVLGGTIGTGPITLQGSLDNGRTWLPESSLGTATTWKLQIPNPGGSPIDTGVQYDFATGTLVTGDSWFEGKTTPPDWAVADMYTAGTPVGASTGALATIAKSSQNFGLVVITEPAIATDIATLSAGLDAMKAIKASCRPTLILRFRDQGAAESDATYIAALATFRAACASDARICVVAGDGWLTDALRDYVYSRSGLPAVLARLQGMSAIAGAKGEKVAQSPGYAKRGPLERFTIRDTSGNPVGHDERVRGGALEPVSGKGGFLCFGYEAHEAVAGTYVMGAPTLFDVSPTVQTLMDNRVSSGIERVLYAVAFTFLQGADVVNSFKLDSDVRDAMAFAAMQEIQRDYASEFANAMDPNLVTVDENVTVSGPNVSVTWYINNKLFYYTNGITVVIQNARG